MGEPPIVPSKTIKHDPGDRDTVYEGVVLDNEPKRVKLETDTSKPYEMEFNKSRLAFIFQLCNDDNTFNRRVTEDIRKLTSVLEKKWSFNVIKPNMTAKESGLPDTELFLQHWIARIFNSDKILEGDEQCVFIAVFYTRDTIKYPLDLWQGMITEESRATARPRVIFLQEYHSLKATTTQGIPNLLPERESGTKTFTTTTQPSHSNIFFIHGFGGDYVTTFCAIVEKNCDKEICELLQNVHKEMKSKIKPKQTPDNELDNSIHTFYPFYTSTLLFDLILTPKGDNRIRPDLPKIQNEIKVEKLFAKERMEIEKKIKNGVGEVIDDRHKVDPIVNTNKETHKKAMEIIHNRLENLEEYRTSLYKRSALDKHTTTRSELPYIEWLEKEITNKAEEYKEAIEKYKALAEEYKEAIEKYKALA